VDRQQRHHADVGGRHGLFLSDRAGTINLFSYDRKTRQVAQLTRHDDFDIMSASAGPDAIVYEQAGYIHLLDTATRKARRLAIEVTADFPWARPQLKKVAPMIRAASLSPTGVRAAFEARGDILTLPAEKGKRAQPDGDLRRPRAQPGVVA
jgi:tricorn protease